ncbi:MAG: phage head-tail connector protein [Porcipelethomonas sp.]
MTQLERLKLKIDDGDDKILNDALESAKSVILVRRFPFGVPENVTDVPAEYKDLQIRIAVELYNRSGAEGQTGHSENGISRTYESAGISQSLINEIVPFCGGIK